MATIYCTYLKKERVKQVDTAVCEKCRKLGKCPDYWGWKQLKLFKDFK